MTEDAPRKPGGFRLIRETGTVRLILGFLALAAVWYGYTTVKVYRMQQIRWPALKPSPSGLTVIGLLDRDAPGRPRKYVAIEANHAWQVRRPDDAVDEEDANEWDAEERASYQPSSSVANRATSGKLVEVPELLATCPIVLTGRHFSGATMDSAYEPFRDTTYYRVHVQLTDEGRSRYWQFSRTHDEERLAFILDGAILTCPRMSHMDTASLTIEPIWVKADAERLAKALSGTR